jgi:hypothetical protein
MASYKHDFGQTITTDAEGVGVDRAFLARYHIDAADAVGADTDGILTASLGTKAQEIEEGFENPAVPRNLTVVANVSGVTGTVTIKGKDFAGEEIEEDFTLNGQMGDTGDLAFKEITKIELPARVHTPAQQSATIQVLTGAVAQAGNITVTVTATTLLGADSPRAVVVALEATDDTAAEVATKIVDALNADEKIKAVFEASATGASEDTIELKTKTPMANDASLAIAIADTGETGVTADASSTPGETGVPNDIVYIGWGEKFGIPYKLYADELVILALVDKAKEGTAGTVTADADELAKNVFDPNASGASLGKDIDMYIIV